MTAYLPTINPTFVIWSSRLLPLPAIMWIVNLGIIAANKITDVQLGQ